MDFNIEKTFKNRKGNLIGKYRESSVMILIKNIEGEPHICFEVRAFGLKHQPGDICLPGGKMEKDENSKGAAIRETCEELNLQSEDLDYIGEMDYFISPYNAIIYAHLARLKVDKINPSKAEVDHVFWVPLKFFMENEPIQAELGINPYFNKDFPFHLIRGGENYKFNKGSMTQYFYQYEDYVIWGFTAKIIKSFLSILSEGR